MKSNADPSAFWISFVCSGSNPRIRIFFCLVWVATLVCFWSLVIAAGSSSRSACTIEFEISPTIPDPPAVNIRFSSSAIRSSVFTSDSCIGILIISSTILTCSVITAFLCSSTCLSRAGLYQGMAVSVLIGLWRSFGRACSCALRNASRVDRPVFL